MSLKDTLYTLSQIPALKKAGKEIAPRPPTTPDCFAARFEKTVSRFGKRTAVIFEGKSLTWDELNEHTNRYAWALKELGLVRGDAVSLVMENRIEFLAALLAMNKLGLIAALINTNLTGKSLCHCINITNSRALIVGEENTAAVGDIREEASLSNMAHYLFVADHNETPCPSWAQDLDELSAGESGKNPPDTLQNTLADRALYIYTSGTTGLPKAAIISNRRFHVSSALSYLGGLQSTEKDRIYLCLPLYHGTGLFLGVGAAFATGASMYIRRRFSASNFLPEIRESKSTCFVYIGELCRYLLNTPQKADDAKTSLVKVMGNGLRPDVWHEFKQRFGIKRVAEFYGSSEGNIGFVNFLNKDCTVGTTTIPLALVKYDVDNDELVKTNDGRCIKVAEGEPGLLLGKITEDTQFDGYSSAEETEKKVLRDAFEDGDAWFNTGDIMKTVDVGFSLGLPHFQFVDRVGDTFRWKSENVSTNEVGEIVNGFPQVNFCNIYGVEIPGTNGRAGMASLVLHESAGDFDIKSFSEYVKEQLPAYARPVFLRIQPDMGTTATFKMVKGDLRKEGYDLALVKDPLYVLKPGQELYEPLDQTYLQSIQSGSGGY
jgi:citronellyl-CoA synthetase